MGCMIRITVMNVQALDLNLLRVLDAVLHEGGVTPAAARLGLTQPAVSNALARLRRVFGDPLFVRSAAGMDATPFARELAEPVRQALALLESALAHGPGFDPATSTRAFRFYMSDLGQIEFLPPLVERVHRDAPGVRLEAVALEVDDIGDGLAVGALDVRLDFCRASARRCDARRFSGIPTSASCVPTTRSRLSRRSASWKPLMRS